VNRTGPAGTEVARRILRQEDSRARFMVESLQFRVVKWWALQDSNLRPLPCESAQGSRQTYTSLIKSSQSLEITKRAGSDLRPALAMFFPRLGPNWVQCLSSKYLPCASALLSVRQVAQLLGVSVAIVYRLCERGELAHL